MREDRRKSFGVEGGAGRVLADPFGKFRQNGGMIGERACRPRNNGYL